MRNLATIRKVAEIRQHTNADALDLVIIDGWQCVAKKGEFKAEDVVVYFEIDSFIPHDIAPFLSKGKEPRSFEGVSGERLRTIKLRGELSQGLVMPLSVLPGEVFPTYDHPMYEGLDVSELLNIKKWEKPLSTQMQGMARGNFPSFIRKTDQERIQNIFRKLTPEQIADTYEVTLKIDGSSTTFYSNDGKAGVCSRNLDLETDESNTDNSFVKMFRSMDVEDKLLNKMIGANIAIQGELYGVGINGNWEGLQDHQFKVFDIFNINTGEYMDAHSRAVVCKHLQLEQVPILDYTSLRQFKTVEDFLEYADRPSINNTIAEGVVFKSLKNPNFSFKVINTKFLLNGGE
jgi:RNA ligase (TIGR02306 family)